jgi:hypothetical protein
LPLSCPVPLLGSHHAKGRLPYRLRCMVLLQRQLGTVWPRQTSHGRIGWHRPGHSRARVSPDLQRGNVCLFQAGIHTTCRRFEASVSNYEMTLFVQECRKAAVPPRVCSGMSRRAWSWSCHGKGNVRRVLPPPLIIIAPP